MSCSNRTFFNYKLKCGIVLQYSMGWKYVIPERKKALLEFCKTWSEKKKQAQKQFYLALLFIIESLEIISGANPNKDESDEYCARDLEATLYIDLVSNFGFIMAIAALHELVNPLTGKQKKCTEEVPKNCEVPKE